MIAVTPTYATIGLAAPILLGLARVIQGLSLGGEYGTSATYLTEVADEKHRGFYSSFQYVTLIGGQLCALSCAFAAAEAVPDAGANSRPGAGASPSLIGGLLAGRRCAMQRNMHETEAFIEAPRSAADENRSIRALLKYPREVLLVVGLTIGGTTAFYTYTTYMQKFLKLSVGLNDDQTTMVTAGFAHLRHVSCSRSTAPSPTGSAANRCSSGSASAARSCTIPLLSSLQAAKTPFAAFLLIAAAWMIVAGYTSINAVVKAELFPTSIRATGVGAALCAHRFDFRRDRGFDRAVVQVDRSRDLVLLLSDRHDRDLARGLPVHARYQEGFRDAPRMTTPRGPLPPALPSYCHPVIYAAETNPR